MANFSALKTAIQNAIRQNGNEEITGNLLQQILLSVVNTMGDGAINTIEQNLSSETLARQNGDNTLQSHIDAEALARGNADTQLQNAINAIKANIDNGYVYAGIATPSTTPVSGKVFYIATAAGTYTNFGGQVLTQGINILRYNGSAWSNQQIIGVDDEPTAGSNNLVKSGGVFEKVISLVDYDNKGVGYLTKDCIEQGSLDGQGGETPSETRIRSAFIPIRKGMKFKFTEGIICKSYIAKLYNQEKIFQSGWGWTSGNEFAIEDDGYIRFLFKYGNVGTNNISPSDFDATISIVTQNRLDITNQNADLDFFIKSEKIDYSASLTWERGGINGNGIDVDSNSMIRSNAYISSIGENITIKCETGYLFDVFKYDYFGNFNERFPSSSELILNNAYGVYRFVIKNMDNNDGQQISIENHISLYSDKNKFIGVNGIRANYTVENNSAYPETVDISTRLMTSEIVNIPNMSLIVNIIEGFEYRVIYLKGLDKVVSDFSTGSFVVKSETNIKIEIRKNTYAKLLPEYANTIFNIYYVPNGVWNNISFDIKPYNAIALSKPEALIAHVSKLAFDPYIFDNYDVDRPEILDKSGSFYCVFYEDDTYNSEQANYTKEYLVLRKFNIQSPNEIETVFEIKGGDTVGNVTFASIKEVIDGVEYEYYSIREPQMFIDNEYIHVFCWANAKIDDEEYENHIWHIRYNKATTEMVVVPCTLDGVNGMHTTLGDITYYNGYYYAGLGTYSEGDAGKIVRSINLTDWESFASITAPTDYPIGAGKCWECVIAIFDEKIHAITRIQGTQGFSSGMFHSVFTITGIQESIYRIFNTKVSRPAWFEINNELYAVLNRATRFEFFSQPYGTYDRSSLMILKLDDNLILQKVYDCIYQPGIHYFSVINYFDSLYMTFTTGIKKCNLSQCRDTVAFVPIEVTEKYNDDLEIQEIS